MRPASPPRRSASVTTSASPPFASGRGGKAGGGRTGRRTRLSPLLSPKRRRPNRRPAPPTAELADLAWRSGAQAIARGEVYKARAWIKLARELREEVKAEENRARWAEHDALERLAADARIAAITARKRAEVAAASGTVDGELHTLHPESDVQSADPDALLEEAEALAAAEAALDANDEDGFEGYIYDEEEEAEAADALARERATEAGLHRLHPENDAPSPEAAAALAIADPAARLTAILHEAGRNGLSPALARALAQTHAAVAGVSPP